MGPSEQLLLRGPKFYPLNFFATRVALCPPKPKELLTIAFHRHLASRVGHVIQVALRVGDLIINRWRHDIRLQGFGANNHLHSARSSQHMAGRSFGGTDREFVGLIAKNRFDGLCLGNVALRRRGAVGIDVGNCSGFRRALRKAMRMQRRRPHLQAKGRLNGERRRCSRSRRIHNKCARPSLWRAPTLPARARLNLRP